MRDGVRALPISSFRQSMPSFYMNAPDCICSPGRLPLGAFCAGRDDLEREALHDDRISIRAPRAGRDFLRLQDIARALISIHAPRVGRDVISRKSRAQESRFQSTRPVWGATTNGVNLCMTSKISIHAPRVGRDNRSIQGCHQGQTFQSTRPVWGATQPYCCSTSSRVFQSTRPVWGATLPLRYLRTT